MLKRILCIDQFSSIGGAQQCLLELTPFIREKGSEVDVILPDPGPLSGKLKTAGCATHFFGAVNLSRKHKPAWQISPYLRSLRSAGHCLQQCIQDRRPDLCYVTGPRYLPAVAFVASSFNVPVLFHAHNRVTQRTALRLLKGVLRECQAHVIACCEYVAASLRTAVPNEYLQVIFNGTADMRPQTALDVRPIRNIGILGRIAPEKGQLTFVRMAHIFAGNPNLRWMVLGSASDEREHQQYLRCIMRESEGSNVTFAGWQEDVASALASIDLLVVPSLPYDAAPRVIAEAFSAGVPVLACACGGIPEIVADGVTGFLSYSCDPGPLAERLADILRLPLSSVCAITAAAREVWNQRFTLQAYRHSVWTAMLATVAQE